MIRRKNDDSLGAFTLAEVLATLTLAAIILPVALNGISAGLGAAADSVRRVEAATLADAKLAELVSTGEFFQTAEKSGDFGDEFPGYLWMVDVADWDGAVIKQVTIRVTWFSRGKERDYSVSTLVYMKQ